MQTTVSNIKPHSSSAKKSNSPQPQVIRRQYRCDRLAEILGVSVSTIWRWNRLGTIPKGRPLSKGTTVWDSEEIDAWLNAKTVA
jgi:predicted DNA-binding transcriptional regulator AlpA